MTNPVSNVLVAVSSLDSEKDGTNQHRHITALEFTANQRADTKFVLTFMQRNTANHILLR